MILALTYLRKKVFALLNNPQICTTLLVGLSPRQIFFLIAFSAFFEAATIRIIY